jgi:hypothetical protein
MFLHTHYGPRKETAIMTPANTVVCRTKKCACSKVKQPCTSCDGFASKCRNKNVHRHPQCKPTTVIVPDATDGFQAPAIAANLAAAQCETNDPSSKETESESFEDA